MKPKLYKSGIFFCLLVVCSIAAARLAYTGPNRTVTVVNEVCRVILQQCQNINGNYKWHRIDAWSCGNESKPWLAYPNYQGPCAEYNVNRTRWEKTTVLVEEEVTYPPATVSGSLNCPTPGQNGWCAGGGQVTMTGAEPVSGYSIYAIEGRQNGTDFACTSTNTCSVPLVEGQNNFEFWALSTFTDTSSLAALSAKQDSVPPQITSNLSGVLASSGWYRSNVTFTASAADATSGLASFTCIQDGAAQASCASGSVSGEGSHTLHFDALDQAGNASQVDHSIGIDSRPPTLTISFDGVNGRNGWYLSAGVTAGSTDPLPGSGSSETQYSLNSGAWTTFSGSYSFPDGTNTVDFRAIDLAENSAQAAAPITAKVDASDPVIDTAVSATAGNNGWYISPASVSGTASDAVSGLSVFETSVDSGGWSVYSSPLAVNDGSHTVSFYAEDAAGRSAQTDLTVNVDTKAPQIGGAISAGTPGLNGWYTSPVTLAGSAADPTPGSGVAVFTASVDGGAPADGSSAINLTDGQHTIVFDAEDTAGLTASLTRTIDVDSVPPSLGVDTSLPTWNRGSVTFTGLAADALSGLARVEISTDNGLTWQSAVGGATWTVDWDTTTAADGDRVVRIRSVDTAGLTTESAFYVGVDNNGPQLNAPASWDVHDSVTLSAADAGSGVDEVVVKIIDPYNRYPTRVLHYEGGAFPLAFTWDRHFEDGTLAPYGDYTVLITAADNFGNESSLSAKVTVPLIGHIFGGYNTATPLPTLLPTFTPTPRGTAPTLAPTPTAASTELAFGVPVTGKGGTSSSAPAAPAQHSSPLSLGFTSFVQDVFFSASGSTVVETSTSSPAQQPLSAASAGVLFGSAAVSATTGLAAYYLQKKKEEEEARRAAILAKIEAEKKAAEKQREAIFEQNAQTAAANLKLAIAAMEEAGAPASSIDQVKENYHKNGITAAMSQAAAVVQYHTTVVPYLHEKEDPVLENYTGKPSMSMSDALKITNPQPELVAVKGTPQEPDTCFVPTTQSSNQTTNWWNGIVNDFKIALEYFEYGNALIQEQAKKGDIAANNVGFSYADTGIARENVKYGTGKTETGSVQQLCYLPVDREKDAKTTENIINIFDTTEKAAEQKKVIFTKKPSGNVTVKVNDYAGDRASARQAIFGETGYGPKSTDIGYPGTNYTPEKLAALTKNGLVKGSVSGAAIVTAGATSLISNGIEYGADAKDFEDFTDKTVKNRYFWVSTIVDAVLSLAAGYGAALLIGSLVAGIMSAGILVPVVLSGLLVFGTAMVIGGIMETFEVDDKFDAAINYVIDSL